jgi:putative flippase GtrA
MLPQLLKFGVVGLAATAVNSLVYLAALARGVAPLLANLLGFACAFALSFFGHLRWTFRQAGAPARGALLKFIATALGGLASNSFMTWLLTAVLQLPPASAVAAILFVTPVLVFVLSRHWVFVRAGGARSAGGAP